MTMQGTRSLGFLTWLILFALLVGLVALLSYATAAPLILRGRNPSLGAWWDAHQFYVMEGAATALGMLIAIRFAAIISDIGRPTSIIAVILAAVALAPMMHFCADAARLGWSGSNESIASQIVSREGYEAGRLVDKVMISGIYFLKTVGFALLAGLGLTAFAAVIGLATGVMDGDEAPAAPPGHFDH